ncbi:hypothetical protein CP985_07690 [Malaciobacter mytili LMG 24559]|uniref:Uncharacterized protein n=1 Tax=Malaciobacter mytili LMG 24559 TaxID=1032238 RepID=A0AAX2AHW9_9BACT|nr:hypothetical protein AMYT_1549 [Malaciobacter mytili LMG 24559]RXK15633.1 hypothetical protein CP985_07690 [Malaciobacter mytili LMG 24559]
MKKIKKYFTLFGILLSTILIKLRNLNSLITNLDKNITVKVYIILLKNELKPIKSHLTKNLGKNRQ